MSLVVKGHRKVAYSPNGTAYRNVTCSPKRTARSKKLYAGLRYQPDQVRVAPPVPGPVPPDSCIIDMCPGDHDVRVDMLSRRLTCSKVHVYQRVNCTIELFYQHEY